MASLIRSVIALNTGDGYLPLWMAFISGIAVFNAFQNYVGTTLTQKVYSETNEGEFSVDLLGTEMAKTIRY